MTAAKNPATTRTAAKRGPQKPLPCPFCGCRPRIVELHVWNVVCDHHPDHYAHSAHWATKEQAIAAWNRRAK